MRTDGERERDATEALRALVARVADDAVPEPVRRLADAARARHAGRSRTGVRAVLAYGSTLRDATPEESLVDLYVLTEDFAAVSDNALSRLGCRLLPPNVYYLDVTDEEGRTWRAKYACLPLTQFAAWMHARNPYFWARFSQPCRIVWTRDAESRARVIEALVAAVRTMLAFARRLAPREKSCETLWREALIATYGSELRVEGPERAGLIVARNRDFMERACALTSQEARSEAIRPLSRGALRLMQTLGKFLAVLRLIKAAFTFAGGADYIAWKIARHTGERVTLTPFERRHPLIAALRHLPRLLRRGAVR